MNNSTNDTILSSNVTQSQCGIPSVDSKGFYTMAVFGASIALLSIINNTILLIIFFTNPYFRKSNAFYLIFLAFFDLIHSCVFVMVLCVGNMFLYLNLVPIFHVWRTYMVPLKTVSQVVMFASSYLLVAASVDRLIGLSKRFSNCTLLSRLLATAIIVGFAIASRGWEAMELQVVFIPACAEEGTGFLGTGWTIQPGLITYNEDYVKYFQTIYRNVASVVIPFILLFCTNLVIILRFSKWGSLRGGYTSSYSRFRGALNRRRAATERPTTTRRPITNRRAVSAQPSRRMGAIFEMAYKQHLDKDKINKNNNLMNSMSDMPKSVPLLAQRNSTTFKSAFTAAYRQTLVAQDSKKRRSRVLSASDSEKKSTTYMLAEKTRRWVEKARKRVRKNSSRTLLLVVLEYLVCNSLSMVITLWEFIDNSYLMEHEAVWDAFSTAVNILTIISCMIRLPTYCLCDVTFRKEVRRVFVNGKFKKSESSAYRLCEQHSVPNNTISPHISSYTPKLRKNGHQYSSYISLPEVVEEVMKHLPDSALSTPQHKPARRTQTFTSPYLSSGEPKPEKPKPEVHHIFGAFGSFSKFRSIDDDLNDDILVEHEARKKTLTHLELL